jgi:hypothetical protein
MGVQAIPTGVYGPLPAGSVGLFLGRSSLTMKGLLVSPGVTTLIFREKLGLWLVLLKLP